MMIRRNMRCVCGANASSTGPAAVGIISLIAVGHIRANEGHEVEYWQTGRRDCAVFASMSVDAVSLVVVSRGNEYNWTLSDELDIAQGVEA